MDEDYDSFNDDDFEDDDDFGADEDDDFGADDGFADDDTFGNDGQLEEERKLDYEVVSTSEIGTMVRKIVESVSQTLGIPAATTEILLRHFSWKKDKLIEDYFSSPEKMYAKVGLPETPVEPQPTSSSSSSSCVKNDEMIECDICVEDVPRKDTAALTCEHRFCSSCWKDYLTDRVSTASTNCIKSTCPQHGCNMPVYDSFFKKFVSDKAWRKYQLFVVKSYVEAQRDMRWCPNPGCENGVRSYVTPLYTVKCDCGHKFCFACYQEGHEPVSCSNLELWLAKCQNDSETAHWIIANTKRCPKCNVRIEKNHGCNHMTCQSCKYEFCWVCMGDWKDHGTQTGGFYKCNRYRAKKVADTEQDTSTVDSKKKAEADLDRYLFYYQRYHNHHQARKFAKRQHERIQERMAKARGSAGSDKSWADVQYLEAANIQIMDCRQVLKYTYAFAYYLADGPEKEVFEFLQQDLEKYTEFLHELSERPIEKINRSEVMNITAVTKKFSDALLEGVARHLTR